MKYLTEERFIVASNSKEALRNYTDNYDRIFGEPERASAFEAVARALPCEDEHDPACESLCTEGAACNCCEL